MKKCIVTTLVISLMVTLFSVTPARANHSNNFWPGVAVGVGSAIILGSLIHASRTHSYDTPAPVHAIVPPTRHHRYPPAYGERWIPGHWVEHYGPYGSYNRYWVAGHWERF
jgi:hypothetical protein